MKIPQQSKTPEAEGLKLTHGKSWEVHRNVHAKPAGTQGWCWVLTHRHVCSGGPPRWNAGRGLAPDQPSSEASERGVCLGRETRVTEHKVFRRNWPREGQVIFFFDPSILNVNEKLQSRTSLSKMYFSVISCSLSQGPGLPQSRANSLPGGS